jgi:hypothetical protein
MVTMVKVVRRNGLRVDSKISGPMIFERWPVYCVKRVRTKIIHCMVYSRHLFLDRQGYLSLCCVDLVMSCLIRRRCRRIQL